MGQEGLELGPFNVGGIVGFQQSSRMDSLQVTLTVSLCQGPWQGHTQCPGAICAFAYLHMGVFPHLAASQPVTEQDKKSDFVTPKEGSLADIVGLSVLFPLPHSWPEWEFGTVWSLAGTQGQEQLPG